MMRILAAILVLGTICGPLRAQDVTDPGSRAAQIENEQAAKAKALSPDIPEKPERRFTRAEHTVEDVLQRAPVHLQVGGLPMDAGFGLGPVQEWANSTDRIRTRVWAIGSVWRSYNVGSRLTLPRLTPEHLTLTFDVSRQDVTRFDFYGIGPNSLKSDRTDYRKEDSRAELGLQWPLLSYFQPKCGVAQDFVQVGAGNNPRVTPTTVKFTPDEVPGLGVNSNFLISGCTLPLDFRDKPTHPHKGTAIFGTFQRFDAENHRQFSFNRVSATAEQYIPFLNEKRVIALHANTELSLHEADHEVPFYLQPTLGGWDDLRGFRPRRFYDENSLVMNAEYRWEVCTGFDMAVFVDEGKVFHRPEDISLSHLQTSAGFGLRFNNQESTVMRVDTGFSREGFQVWFVFNKVF